MFYFGSQSRAWISGKRLEIVNRYMLYSINSIIVYQGGGQIRDISDASIYCTIDSSSTTSKKLPVGISATDECNTCLLRTWPTFSCAICVSCTHFSLSFMSRLDFLPVSSILIVCLCVCVFLCFCVFSPLIYHFPVGFAHK